MLEFVNNISARGTVEDEAYHDRFGYCEVCVSRSRRRRCGRVGAAPSARPPNVTLGRATSVARSENPLFSQRRAWSCRQAVADIRTLTGRPAFNPTVDPRDGPFAPTGPPIRPRMTDRGAVRSLLGRAVFLWRAGASVAPPLRSEARQIKIKNGGAARPGRASSRSG